MSDTIDQAFVKQFEREVHMAYQRMGSKLRGLFRTVNGVRGLTTRFQKVGKGVAGTKTRHGLVPVMNLDHSYVEVTLVDRFAGEWIDNLDLLKINHDERGVVTESAAYALGRATDADIITALGTVATNISAITVSSEAAIRNSILSARQDIAERDVPMNALWGIISPSMYAQFMTVEEFASSDYVGPDFPYRSAAGRIHNWLGVNWIEHTGLDLETTTRSGFLAHRNAIGHAIGADVSTKVSWENTRDAWFVNANMSMGAVLIDNDGVQELTLDESSALPTS